MSVPANEPPSKPPADVVLPPSNVRTIIETTAKYIIRNGVAFEDKIRKNAANNNKLGFINEDDPYHSFYVWRLREIREGRGSATDRDTEGANAPIPDAPKGPPAPPEFQFSTRMPNISAKDLDVVRLTALFVAKKGRSFLTTLSQKEAGNFQFDFLRPQHSLYQFFSRLIDQYTLLLDTGDSGQARKADLTKINAQRSYLFDRARQRAEYVKFQEQQRTKKEEKDEKEALEYAQIDWHDFVVVETVIFTDADDEVPLPPPTSLGDLQSASLEQKGAVSLTNMRIEEAVPFQDESYGMNQQVPAQAFPSRPPAFSPAPQNNQMAEPPREFAAAPSQPNPSTAARALNSAAPINIRSDYVPRAQQRRAGNNQVICPNCNLPVPSDQLNEHMRIELLDPKWQSQRAKAEGRSATTNLNTTDFQNNLKRLASQRTDVFDSATGQPLTPEESDRRKRVTAGATQKVNTSQEGRSIQEQLAHIANKAKNS